MISQCRELIAELMHSGDCDKHLCAVGDDALRDARKRVEQGGCLPRADAVVLGHFLCDRVCHDDRDGVVCRCNVEQGDEKTDAELSALSSTEDLVDGLKQNVKTAVFADQRAHCGDENRDHAGLKHSGSARSHVGEHLPRCRLSGSEHDQRAGDDAG